MIPVKKIKNDLRDIFVAKLKKEGEDGLFVTIIKEWSVITNASEDSEIAILETSEGFFSLFRRTGDEDHFKIGKVFRRAAHYIYRTNLKQYKNKKPNYKQFLNLVKKNDYSE